MPPRSCRSQIDTDRLSNRSTSAFAPLSPVTPSRAPLGAIANCNVTGLKDAVRLDEVRRLESPESLHAVVCASLVAAARARDITGKLNELEASSDEPEAVSGCGRRVVHASRFDKSSSRHR